MRLLAGLSLLLLASGCDRLLAFGAGSSPPHQRGGRDRSFERWIGDGPRGETRALDGQAPAGDAARPLELGAADAVRKPDLAVKLDAGKKPDGGVLYGGCNLSLATELPGLSAIAFCRALDSVAQQGAPSLCNQAAGWHLCPASVYRSVFHANATQQPPLGNLWIAGCCMVSGQSVSTPVDGACTCNSISIVGGPQAAISCTLPGPLYAQDKCNGVVTAMTCNVIGYQIGQGGFWTVQPVSSMQLGAVCCK